MPIVPHLNFGVEQDGRDFKATFAAFPPKDAGQVIKTFVTAEDELMNPDMLDSLFESDLTEL